MFNNIFRQFHIKKINFNKKIMRRPMCMMLVFLMCAVSLSGTHITAQASGIMTGMNQSEIPDGAKQPEVSADTNQPKTMDGAKQPEVSADTNQSEISTDTELPELAAKRSIMALVYLCEEAEVRSRASQDSAVTAKAAVGQTVFIQDAVYNEEDGILWIDVEFMADGVMHRGYIERYLLACSDERFLAWEKQFMQSAGIGDISVYGTAGIGLFAAGTSGVSADVAQFPESYQAGLTALKKAHPKWIFVPMNTGLDWNTVITNELKGGKSLVHKSFPDYTKDGAYDDGQWFYATRGILEYYMDPRNAFTDSRIFQFELLTYNETYHTEKAVETFLQNTFMRSPGNAPGTVMTYAHIFWAIGKEEGREVSPFHLASRVYQEQGQGTSPLISGTYPGYEGYYNYFNVGASGTSTTQVIENGLKYAKEHGWNNAYYSILGGADTIATNYIKKGQDTLYLQKYNVNPNGSYALYTHQYMQNISAPTTESESIRKLYTSAGSLDCDFVFKIPVYKNMPANASPYPQDPATMKETKDITLKIGSDYDKTVWVDGVPYTPTVSGSEYKVELSDTKAKSAVVYSYDGNGIPTGMYVWTLSYENKSYVVKPQEDLKDLIIYQGSSVRVSGDAGLRVKMEVNAQTKEKLTAPGIDGYLMKEYGTLATDVEDAESNPFVRGKEGIAAQQQPAYVIGSISPSRYNTVFSFRGYVVLMKDGADTVIYGPIVKKSMVSVASQALAEGVYEEGSAEDAYLREILEDAKQ